MLVRQANRIGTGAQGGPEAILRELAEPSCAAKSDCGATGEEERGLFPSPRSHTHTLSLFSSILI